MEDRMLDTWMEVQTVMENQMLDIWMEVLIGYRGLNVKQVVKFCQVKLNQMLSMKSKVQTS